MAHKLWCLCSSRRKPRPLRLEDCASQMAKHTCNLVCTNEKPPYSRMSPKRPPRSDARFQAGLGLGQPSQIFRGSSWPSRYNSRAWDAFSAGLLDIAISWLLFVMRKGSVWHPGHIGCADGFPWFGSGNASTSNIADSVRRFFWVSKDASRSSR